MPHIRTHKHMYVNTLNSRRSHIFLVARLLRRDRLSQTLHLRGCGIESLKENMCKDDKIVRANQKVWRVSQNVRCCPTTSDNGHA